MVVWYMSSVTIILAVSPCVYGMPLLEVVKDSFSKMEKKKTSLYKKGASRELGYLMFF